MENLNALLDGTMHGSPIYTMTEKIKFFNLAQTQYQFLAFEHELFDALLRNRFAIQNDSKPNEEGVTYANSDYPFSLIICSKDACRSSILLNNTGMVIIKFILYLRMLNKYAGHPSSPNYFLAVNLKQLPFSRLCIDVDYKMSTFSNESENNISDDEYQELIKECCKIVKKYTTTGDIMITTNCFTANTRSFHLITEQQFDVGTRDFLFKKIAREITYLNACISIDQVHVWMLPFGRGHVPTFRHVHTNNTMKTLTYPYIEHDFELAMPFDLTSGIDNIYTLFCFTVTDDIDEDGDSHDVLNEYLENEVVHSYYLNVDENIKTNMQLFAKILSYKYSFAFRSQFNYHFVPNYLAHVMCNKYNNYFIIMSSKKLLFESNWHIPKPKMKKRPTEFYEIYRFIEPELEESITCLEQLFEKMPTDLVKKNVYIGDVNENMITVNPNSVVANQENCTISEVFTGDVHFDFNFHEMSNEEIDLFDYLHDSNHQHPWAYLIENPQELTSIASVPMRSVHEYFHKTIINNVYTYEKSNDNVMMYFKNIQSMLSKDIDEFGEIINKICKVLLAGDVQKLQKYIFPLYEFFCRVHYIDACITTSEHQHIRNGILRDTLNINMEDEMLNMYRNKCLEMFVSKKAYRKFPIPDTPLDKIWSTLIPEFKVILHVIYLMMVEHNYTSIFVYMHNLLRTNNVTHMVCSFLLNIIDDSYVDKETQNVVHSYASKEFLNFIYMMFINGGTNVKCNFENGNVKFNMVNLQSFISDLQMMFYASPIWFFLCNFQYVDEHMSLPMRFELFTYIFQQGATDGVMSVRDSDNRSRSDGPPPAKQAKKMIVIQHEKVFKNNGIPEMFYADLMNIFYKYIAAFCSTDNGKYMYDATAFTGQGLPETIVKPHIVRDPLKYSIMYRQQYGIYNTWTMQMERNTSILYTHIHISNDEFDKYPELFTPYNDAIYRIIVNRYLKAIMFTRILNYQKTLGLYMAPIYNPTVDMKKIEQYLMHNIDSVQINIHDLASPDFVTNEEMFTDILKKNNKLYEMFKWLYAIICHYSEHYSCKITTPSSFIPKTILPQVVEQNENHNGENGGGIESTYSMFQHQIADSAYQQNNEENEGENLIQRIHKILNSKKSEQQQNITDELQKLSQQELTSLIVLFDNVSTHHDNNEEEEQITELIHNGIINNSESQEPLSPSTSNSSGTTSEKKTASPSDEISMLNLSTRGSSANMRCTEFFDNDEYIDNAKIRLLLNLFNRKMSNDIIQIPMESFEKIIEENFGNHIVKFVLLILSWFIRTTHTHIFTETLFFRELQQYRQTLYDQLSELVFKHHGYYIINDSMVNVTKLYSLYCRNVRIVVDPIFEMSFVIDKDLYLDYDPELEATVSRDTIHDIETACVSSIYQGQFIENTNVDLCRMWARVTVPRNKHRISPIFTLHTSTGKSDYISERCRRHFNNKQFANYLDSSSLKTNDRGVDMAPELNANLIVCIEEFAVLQEKFKLICGHSAITYKPLWSDSKSSFQNNATVILATNNDPKCTEEAVIARLHIFPRRIQYAAVNKYLKFERINICSTATNLNINNIMTVQLIMEKIPRAHAENYRGNNMLIWILKRFFLYNIFDPITVQASETLQYHIDNFQNMINAPQIILERLEPHKGTMTLFQFRKLVNRICEENRSLFNSKVDAYNVYTILTDKLKSLIDIDNQTINIAEKEEKI
ncbi:virulence associated protein E [Drosophila suzukii associated hytrosavirus 1]|nr:virulence associated protein E [Drosophila suzukii associated hytrosavirus 1]